MATRLRSARGRHLWPKAALLNRGRTWLAGENPEAALYTILSKTLRLFTLPAMCFRLDPTSDLELTALARRLAEPLGAFVLSKLAVRFKKDMDRLTKRFEKKKLLRQRWSQLIRYHPDDTLAYAAQAVEWTGDLLSRDFQVHPHDPVRARVERVGRIITTAPGLPSWKGRRSTWVGKDYDLWLLVRYEAWMNALADAFSARDWGDTQPADRAKVIAQYQDNGPLTPQLLQDTSACASREDAALLIVAGTAPHARLTARSLQDVLRRTRPRARRLDRPGR